MIKSDFGAENLFFVVELFDILSSILVTVLIVIRTQCRKKSSRIPSFIYDVFWLQNSLNLEWFFFAVVV